MSARVSVNWLAGRVVVGDVTFTPKVRRATLRMLATLVNGGWHETRQFIGPLGYRSAADCIVAICADSPELAACGVRLEGFGGLLRLVQPGGAA